MANKLYEESSIQGIADAIRTKGQTGTMTVAQMAQKILDLKTVKITTGTWTQVKTSPYANDGSVIDPEETPFEIAHGLGILPTVVFIQITDESGRGAQIRNRIFRACTASFNNFDGKIKYPIGSLVSGGLADAIDGISEMDETMFIPPTDIDEILTYDDGFTYRWYACYFGLPEETEQ